MKNVGSGIVGFTCKKEESSELFVPTFCQNFQLVKNLKIEHFFPIYCYLAYFIQFER